MRASIPPVNAQDYIGEGLYKSVFSLNESQEEENEIIGAAKKEVMRAFDSSRPIEIEIVDNSPPKKSSPSVIIEDDESIDNYDRSPIPDLNQTQMWTLDHKIVELTDKDNLLEFQG